MSVFNPYLPLDTYIPDGEPHIFGDRLYVFGSHDEEGGDVFCPLDYEVWSAPLDDLTAWRCEGTTYCAAQDPSYTPGGKYERLYAPDVVQGPDGRYYLYYAMSGKAFTGPIHVAVCDTPAGKYEYYGCVRNPDGTDFDRCITFDPGLLNDNGRIWLYYGWAISSPTMRGLKGARRQLQKKTLMPILEQKLFDKTKAQIEREPHGIQGANVVELDKDMLTVLGEPSRIVPGLIDAEGTSFEGHAFFEASSIRKIEDTYYFIYSDERYHELCYATSEYPDRGFTYEGVLVSNGDLVKDDRLKKPQTEFTTNNHGSLVEVNGKWYIFYHRHTHKTQYSRQGMADKIQRLSDGTFLQAEVTSCGLNPGPLPTEGEYPAPIACNIACGTYPLNLNLIRNKPYPHVTHHNDKHLIAEITDGTRLTYRYFQFTGPVQLTLWLRGSAEGTVDVSVDDMKQAEITVDPTRPWTRYTVTIDSIGKQALILEFHGKGELRFWKFAFSPAAND